MQTSVKTDQFRWVEQSLLNKKYLMNLTAAYPSYQMEQHW